MQPTTNRSLNIELIRFWPAFVHKVLKVFECYMVKPHGQLVLVSFIHY
jgi:hypothetical protein